MSQTITLRVADSVVAWLKSWARRSGRSVNDIGSMLLEEAKVVSEFAEIEFRTVVGERHACVKGQLEVWQVIMVARRLDMDPRRVAEYFGWPEWRAQAALTYYRAFPDEIDCAVADNDAIGYEELMRMFPQMRLTAVNLADGVESEDSSREDVAAEAHSVYDAQKSG